MAPKIVPWIPPHTVYCEPFAGGAAVFYAKPTPEGATPSTYREVLNDINGRLVNMYRVAMSSPHSFSDTVLSIPFAAAVHRGGKCDYGESKASAVAYYTTMKQSFGNQEMGGWGRGTISQNWANSYASSLKDCRASAERLTGVYLDSISAVACIQRWDSPQTFFYVDPPYVGTCIKGMGKWGEDDLIELTRTLADTKGSYIMSEYRSALPHLDAQKVIAFQHHAGLGAGRTRKSRNHGEAQQADTGQRVEYLHMRGPTQSVRSSLLPVLQKQGCFPGPRLGPVPIF